MNNMFNDQPGQPFRLTVSAIDLNAEDESGIVITILDTTGIRIDVPMSRQHAELFGLSLADFASAQSWIN